MNKQQRPWLDHTYEKADLTLDWAVKPQLNQSYFWTSTVITQNNIQTRWVLANSVDPDHIAYKEQTDLSLHCLPFSQLFLKHILIQSNGLD